MRWRLGCFILILFATAAPAASAQEYAVSRRSYPFFERALTIEVLADGPGALQVVRGEPGRLEVAAHARDGLAAWGLGGHWRDRLRLSALGALESDYVVIVPEDVHVSVTLPGEHGARSVSYDPAALLRWDVDFDDRSFDSTDMVGTGPVGGLFPVHRAATSPRRMELSDAASLQSLEVRLEGDEFLVASSAPLSFTPGSGPLLIRTRDHLLDLVVTLPRGTREFEVVGPEGAIVVLDSGHLRSPCQPSIAMQLPGRQSIALRPAESPLRCP
jgi:hypothetical protein